MSDNTNTADWLTVTQVAQRLRVADRTVRRWIELNYFPNAERTSPARKAEYRIPLTDVEQFEQSRKVS